MFWRVAFLKNDGLLLIYFRLGLELFKFANEYVLFIYFYGSVLIICFEGTILGREW